MVGKLHQKPLAAEKGPATIWETTGGKTPGLEEEILSARLSGKKPILKKKKILQGGTNRNIFRGYGTFILKRRDKREKAWIISSRVIK